jgi:hypothetical protein
VFHLARIGVEECKGVFGLHPQRVDDVIQRNADLHALLFSQSRQIGTGRSAARRTFSSPEAYALCCA